MSDWSAPSEAASRLMALRSNLAEPGSAAYLDIETVCRALTAGRTEGEARPCTCHPDDNPPRPCPRKYALSECRAAAQPPSPGEPIVEPPASGQGGEEEVFIPEQARLGAQSAPPEGWRLLEDKPTRACGVVMWFPLGSAINPDGSPETDVVIGQDYRMQIGWWDGRRFLEQGTSHDVLHEAGMTADGSLDPRAVPTHWQPLPEPPAPSDGAERVHEGKLRDEPSPALEVAVKALERIARGRGGVVEREQPHERTMTAEEFARQALASIRSA